jgi:uncharacterized protein (DUF697 family)
MKALSKRRPNLSAVATTTYVGTAALVGALSSALSYTVTHNKRSAIASGVAGVAVGLVLVASMRHL